MGNSRFAFLAGQQDPGRRAAGRFSNPRAAGPARLPNLKPMPITPEDSRYERGTTGGRSAAIPALHPGLPIQ